MKQETKRFSSLIIAALIIAGALVVYFEFIVPAYTNLESIKGEEESATTLLANENQIVTQGKSLLSTYQSDTASSQAVASALPVGQNIAGALAQIYGIAANTGITINGTGITVQAVSEVAPQAVAAATTTGDITSAAMAGSIIKPTGTLSFQVSGTGSYESFKNFLHGIETNVRIFDVSAVSIQPAAITATKTQAGNSDNFNFTITVVTYYQAP